MLEANKKARQIATQIFNGDCDFINVTYHQDYLNILDLYDRLAIKKLAI